MSLPDELRDAARARSIGSFAAFAEVPAGERPPDWIDYRASVARAARRLDAGETVLRCGGCDTELDVDAAVHSPRCAGGDSYLEGPEERPLEEEPPDEDPLDGPDRDDALAGELAEASLTATRLTLQLLRTSAAELAELGASDPAIAHHFANVCTQALDLLDAGEDA